MFFRVENRSYLPLGERQHFCYYSFKKDILMRTMCTVHLNLNFESGNSRLCALRLRATKLPNSASCLKHCTERLYQKHLLALSPSETQERLSTPKSLPCALSRFHRVPHFADGPTASNRPHTCAARLSARLPTLAPPQCTTSDVTI